MSITFSKSGYLPTDYKNCAQRYTSIYHEYGIYLNQDPDICELHKKAFHNSDEGHLKKIYESQGKPTFSYVNPYPNAPFIVFKTNKSKLKVRA